MLLLPHAPSLPLPSPPLPSLTQWNQGTWVTSLSAGSLGRQTRSRGGPLQTSCVRMVYWTTNSPQLQWPCHNDQSVQNALSPPHNLLAYTVCPILCFINPKTFWFYLNLLRFTPIIIFAVGCDQVCFDTQLCVTVFNIVTGICLIDLVCSVCAMM